MKKIKIIIILILAAAVLGAGFYFKDSIIKLYSDFGKNIQSFQKTDIGNIITEAGKEIFTPPPLRIGGPSRDVVLVKSKVVEETNIQRQNNGLPVLTENYNLEQAALAKAYDMFNNQYFEHISPSGAGPGDLAKEYGYDFIVEGENLILGNFASEKEMVQEWMDSPGHRANILNNRYAEIGVAVVKGTYEGSTVWIGVQEFGLPLSACQSPDIALKNKIDFNKTNLDSLSLEISGIKDQINNMNPKRPDYNQTVTEYNNLVKSYNDLADETKNLINQYNGQVNIFNECVAGG